MSAHRKKKTVFYNENKQFNVQLKCQSFVRRTEQLRHVLCAAAEHQPEALTLLHTKYREEVNEGLVGIARGYNLIGIRCRCSAETAIRPT